MQAPCQSVLLFAHAFVMLTMFTIGRILFVRATDSLATIERKVQNMTDLIQALSTALDRLAKVESMLARLDRLEILLNELGTSVARTDDRVSMLESGDGEDLDDRVGAILDRKLDHVLEDALDNALSGREITVTL